MKKLDYECICFLISRVLENANEAMKENDFSDFAKGKRMAYYEILDTLKNELEARDVDISEIGLNFELEKLVG